MFNKKIYFFLTFYQISYLDNIFAGVSFTTNKYGDNEINKNIARVAT